MKLNKEEMMELTMKKVVIITNSNFTYNCLILSHGEDYLKIKDKYDQTRFIVLEDIKNIEVLE